MQDGFFAKQLASSDPPSPEHTSQCRGAAVLGGILAHGRCTPMMGAGVRYFLTAPMSSFQALPPWPAACM